MKNYSHYYSQKPPPGFVWLCYSCTEELCTACTPSKKTVPIIDQTPEATAPPINDIADNAPENPPTTPPIVEIANEEDQNLKLKP